MRSPTASVTGHAARPGRPGLGGRFALARGGVFPAGQERGRVGSLSGPVLAGVVCPHHLVHARVGLARGDQGYCRKRGLGVSEAGMTGFTLSEIRRLLISLAHRYLPEPEHVWSWSGLAAPTAVPGSAVSLPPTWIPAHESAVTVLGVRSHRRQPMSRTACPSLPCCAVVASGEAVQDGQERCLRDDRDGKLACLLGLPGQRVRIGGDQDGRLPAHGRGDADTDRCGVRDDVVTLTCQRRVRLAAPLACRWPVGVGLEGTGGSTRRLDQRGQTRLALALEEGPAAHGVGEDQRWTLARDATRLFGVCTADCRCRRT